MTSLNLSINGPSIRSSYESVLNGTEPPSFPQNHARWALFSVQAPLMNAFQDSGAKESILKVDGTDSGDLETLIEDLNDGRIQFAFVKVKDPNTKLPKNVLIAWCGAGVPERTKGYFTSHLNAVTKVLHSYHVQITARSTDDLSTEIIMKKVADASGAKYSADSSGPASSGGAPPPVAKKPIVFTPTSYSATSHNPIVAARNRQTAGTDNDGWGEDAPPVTRTQIEKVDSAYKPTKVNIAELTKQKSETTSSGGFNRESSDVIGGGYKPVGKVDIAAIRAAAKKNQDDRPTEVKGAYVPVGKVDIAAIRAKARRAGDDESDKPTPIATALEPSKSLADRSAAFSHSDSASERLTSLPKPKVANKFGGGASFGTKAPTPGGAGLGFGSAPPKPAPIGSASRTFADQGGKTPAQLWAEKKAKQAGGVGTGSLSSPSPASSETPLASQKSGGEWKSGYTGKSWASVQTPNYGHGAVAEQRTGESQPDDTRSAQEAPASPSGGVSALRDRFKGAQPIGQHASSAPSIPATHTGERDLDDEPAPPPIPLGSRPSGALPGLPSRPAAAEEEEEEPLPEREESPVRLAVPVARAPVPEPEPEPEPPVQESIPAPAKAPAAASRPVPVPVLEPEEEEEEPSADGVRAVIQYDYEKAEDNEIDLVEGEIVTNIEQIDPDWWMGTNQKGQSGLFPSNYVEIIDDDAPVPSSAPASKGPSAASHPPVPPADPEPEETESDDRAPSAIAQYDYEASEDNEISFPEGARITNIQFPDEDWWLGTYKGDTGLFPSNYVELVQ